MSGSLFVISIPKVQNEFKLDKFKISKVLVADNVPNGNDADDGESSSPGSVDDDVLLNKLSAEEIVNQSLKALGIKDAIWSESAHKDFWQITFSVQNQLQTERALRILRGADIGTRSDTSISVIPCSLSYRSPESRSSKQDEDSDTETPGAWSNFIQSAATRQIVAQVVEQIKNDAALTFDYCSLITVAALVAALGLVENSTVFIVSSMLISPLMVITTDQIYNVIQGPIVAGSFGTAIKDRALLKTGIFHELFGLLLCVIIGFLFGVIVCSFDELYNVKELPTSEILSRCDLRSLWVGVLIAFPSGAAVSIGLLSNNISSLVGVAISASLLPPAVNAGLLWGMSLIQVFMDETKFKIVKSHVYSHNPSVELAIDGCISFCLTLINIGCIYLAGLIVYKIKDIAPAMFHDSDFWRNAIKTMRELNKNNDTPEIERINRLRDLTASCNGIRTNINQDLLSRKICLVQNNMTWSPSAVEEPRISAKDIRVYRRHSEIPKMNDLLEISDNSKLKYTKLIEPENSEELLNMPTTSSSDSVRRSKFTVVPVVECE